MTSTAYFNRDAAGNIDDVTLGTATTTVSSNTVTLVVLAAKSGQTANVSGAGNGTIVRTGSDTVTYTATATNGGNAVPGAVVWFTLGTGSGTTLADLTANGAAVPPPVMSR